MIEELEKRIQNGIQYRTLEMRAAEPGDGEASYVVEGYATTYNQPYTLFEDSGLRLREQVAPTAFNEADLGDVIFQFNHSGKVFARTRNNTLIVRPDERGLFIRADLSGTEGGKELYNEIRGGYVDRMSFAFVVDGDAQTRSEADGIADYLRTITRIKKVYDVSAVSIPANDETSISARSYLDGIREAEKAEAQRKQAAAEREEKLETLKRMLIC